MRSILLTCLPVLISLSPATADGIYKKSVKMDFESAYRKVSAALENKRIFVIDEIGMGSSLARSKDKWDDFNQNNWNNRKS